MEKQSLFAITLQNTRPALCTILARGGSKGVPGKNKRLLAGKPLLAHTIDVAKRSGVFDEIAFSSDSEELLDLAKVHGATVTIRRPEDLATDSSGKLPAIHHCVTEVESLKGFQFQTIVDLDVTSPLRSVEDIKAVLSLLYSSNATNVITGVKARRSPYFNLVETQKDGYVSVSKKPGTPILRRQDAPQCFDMNASIYAWRRADFEHCTGALMDRTLLYEMHEHSAFDIDSEVDFQIVEFLLQEQAK